MPLITRKRWPGRGFKNTWIRCEGAAEIAVVLYNTRIVEMLPHMDGVRLNTGGWKTATTERRINQTLCRWGFGFRIYTDRNGVWRVDTGSRPSSLFYDGMEITGRGAARPGYVSMYHSLAALAEGPPKRRTKFVPAEQRAELWMSRMDGIQLQKVVRRGVKGVVLTFKGHVDICGMHVGIAKAMGLPYNDATWSFRGVAGDYECGTGAASVAQIHRAWRAVRSGAFFPINGDNFWNAREPRPPKFIPAEQREEL